MSAVRVATDRLKFPAACVLIAAGLWMLGPPGGTDGDDCVRPVSFTANWSSKTMKATTIRWGARHQEVPESNARPPWQRPNIPMPCGKLVRLSVVFPGPPGEVLVAITANGQVYDARFTDERGLRWSVEVVVER